MSSVVLDGSHTSVLRGGEACGYQGRKKHKTTNALYLTDHQELLIVMSVPESGEHNDIHDIENVIESMFGDLEKANICISRRCTGTDNIFIDQELYAERYTVERTNAWMDSYHTILDHFDTTVVTSW